MLENEKDGKKVKAREQEKINGIIQRIYHYCLNWNSTILYSEEMIGL